MVCWRRLATRPRVWSRLEDCMLREATKCLVTTRRLQPSRLDQVSGHDSKTVTFATRPSLISSILQPKFSDSCFTSTNPQVPVPSSSLSLSPDTSEIFWEVGDFSHYL
ncbi:hypothetical protein L2E82_47882 [Cichorium intybus]|uniref:Uncharacterized protein n=1 Tax=Cichorium intybus TaxID=13427 RepID=A0ACB8YWL8_CICIN|nr:hypothetical protein L2E82_47882 [Cichorium intybus]